MQSATRKGKYVDLHNIQNTSDEYIFRSSKIIKKFKQVFPTTEFYSFDDACLEGGPVSHLLKVLGIHDLTEFQEVRLNDDISNKLTRLGEYINKQEPRFVRHKVNPVRRYFRLEDLEFNVEKFLLTRDEAKQVESSLNKERQEIKRLTGIVFNPEIQYSGDSRLSINEVKVITEKVTGINVWMKVLIWNYLRSNSDAGIDIQKQLFLSQEEDLDADMLRDTALLWEKKDLKLSYMFMAMAQKRKPKGQLINQKFNEYQKKLKNPDLG